MIDFDYLSKGLNALARAHQMGAMAGHLGASVLSGYFIGEQQADLDKVVYRGIEADLDKVMRGESVFGRKMSKASPLLDSELFMPFPDREDGTSDAGLIDGIAADLKKSLQAPRQSGHNVIFASLAIRALKDHPEFATPAVVDGIRKLMLLFKNQHPGSGNYGKGKGRMSGSKVVLPEEDKTPVYHDLGGMVEAVFDELIDQDPKVHRQGYGGLVHIVNHAAAIVDVVNYGYPELAAPAIRSHRLHLRLWRNLPNLVDELGPVKISKSTPDLATYWSAEDIPYDRALLTHRVKTMYGFEQLAASSDDRVKGKRAYSMLRLLM